MEEHWAWWYMLVTMTTQELKAGKSQVSSQPGKLSLKIKFKKWPRV
jgi:hypothetical protein